MASAGDLPASAMATATVGVIEATALGLAQGTVGAVAVMVGADVVTATALALEWASAFGTDGAVAAGAVTAMATAQA